MKELSLRFLLAGLFLCLILPAGNQLAAQQKRLPPHAIKNLYRHILAGADRNRDKILSLEECMTISKNKKKIEKDCKYWDANGDGYITEEEYVLQVKAATR